MLWDITSFLNTYAKKETNQWITAFAIISNLQTNYRLKLDRLKLNVQNVDQHAGWKWLIHETKHRKDDQLQKLELPCRIS